MSKIIGALAVWLALCGAALAQTCPGLPFTFTANTTIRSAQVNSNFTSLLNCQNALLAPLASPVFSGSVVIPTLNVTGAETVGSTLGVTGAATVGGTLGVTGATTHSGLLTMSGAAVNEAFGTIASAATTNIGASAANYLQVTGTTGITAFDTIQAGTERTLEFAAALVLTNSGSLILPEGANVTTAAGDVFKFRSEGAGVWRAVAWPARFASKSIMQAATDNVAVVTPSQLQNHPGVAKVWALYNGAGATLLASYNVASVTNNGAGDYTITFTTPFASVNYACTGSTAGGAIVEMLIKAVGTLRVLSVSLTNTPVDQTVNVSCFGSQ